MTTQEVANSLVKLCTEGKMMEALKTLYSPDVVSVEAGAPPGQSREAKGFAAVQAKSEFWIANHEIHSFTTEGPLVAGAHFAVVFKMDVTFKPQSRRFQIEEVAIYKVADGKIVYEEFFYSM
ncbi:MAG TPA: nuclear transport factor 2 family protein [Bryobacteraceae bacterium]|nr:nuclear transport factor 2 family protein [Bryobacteraceae bacterium]